MAFNATIRKVAFSTRLPAISHCPYELASLAVGVVQAACGKWSGKIQMPIHDYFRANDAKAAMQAMDRLVGPLGPDPAFDGVATKNIDPTVMLGKLVAFIRAMPWKVRIVPIAVIWPPGPKPVTKEEYDQLPADSPWRHGPWLQELDNEARNTLASVDDTRIPGLAVMWANIDEFKVYRKVGYVTIESMLELINNLVGLARRARDAGAHL